MHFSRFQGSRWVVAALTVASLAPLGDAAVVFQDNFSTSTLNSATNSPTASSTNYNVASNKNASTTLGPNDLKIAISTSSGFAEAQALFTTTPLTLATAGDSIEATVVFTDTSSMLSAAGAYTYLGLYNSHGSAPLNTLASSGLATTATNATTGGVAGWQGYVGDISAVGSNGHQVVTRDAQNGTNNTNQDLVQISALGGYNSPAGVAVGSYVANTSNTTTNGSQYTQDLLITLIAPGTLSFTSTLYTGNSTAGTVWGQFTGTASGSNFLTSTFDGLAFGYRGATQTMDANSLTINANISPVPEPASLGLSAVGAVALLYRRRRRA